MDKDHIKILVVLYNKKVEESETISSLINFKKKINSNTSIIIWNNSTNVLSYEAKDYLNKNLHPVSVVILGDDGRNTPLTYIYTSVYTNSNKSDILVLFDHDTNIPANYFNELSESVAENKDINLFLPIIYYSNKIVSPSYTFGVKGVSWKKPHYGVIKSAHVTAINSGMAIRCNYLISRFTGYNMSLKFYETDNDFMAKYVKQNPSLYVLKSTISHTLNFYEDSSVESKLQRYKSMKEGRLIRLKAISKSLFILGCIQYLYFGFKCAILYKDIRFIDLNFK